jgi:hypothetical protein
LRPNKKTAMRARIPRNKIVFLAIGGRRLLIEFFCLFMLSVFFTLFVRHILPFAFSLLFVDGSRSDNWWTALHVDKSPLIQFLSFLMFCMLFTLFAVFIAL